MVILFYLFVSDSHVQLGGSYTCVSKHFLDRSDWYPGCNHAAGKGVAQLVTSNPNIRLATVLGQLQLNTGYRDPLPTPVQGGFSPIMARRPDT